jgi:hypothetical protein
VTSNLAGRPTDFLSCCDQPIAQILVIPLSMIMLKELAYCPADGPLPEEDPAIQALHLEAPQESLQVRVQSRRPRWQPD